MKKTYFILPVMVILLSLLAISSCKDPCKDVDCNNGTCIEGDCACEPGYSGPTCTNFDACFNVFCGDHGACLDGLCECDLGYSGVDCSILLRAAYIGTYDAAEICSSDPTYTDNYTAEVKVSGTGDEYIIITNLYNHFSASSPGTYQPTDTQVKATVSDAGLTIPTQSWTATGLEDFEVSGTGTVIAGTTFEINFILTNTSLNPGDPGYQDNCYVTYVLQ